MNIKLPLEVENIISILESNGHEAYAVGGCVRDCILGKNPKDWDITTSAKPEQVKALFKRTIDTGIQHGTVTVMCGNNGYEVTTYRVDGKYTDGRHPESVEFTSDLVEDLKRRDFTINAMAYNEKSGLVDCFDGMGDLEKGLIRCVGEPEKRFGEDALRMMRAIRFSARFAFPIEEETYNAIVDLAPTLEKVSMERIREEFLGVITSDNPSAIHTLYETGLTKIFFPEWDLMEKTEQNTVHHLYTVAEHTVKVMEGVDKSPVLRLAACLHDVAKPACKTTDEEGDHFKNHPQVGAEMTKKILRRLKFDNDTIKMVSTLVLYHDVRPEDSKRTVRRLLNKTGLFIYPDLFALKIADTMGQSLYKREEKLQQVYDFEKNYEAVLKDQEALSIKDLAIKGVDVMSLGVSAGPDVGLVLSALLDHVLDVPEDNNRDKLIKLAEDYIKNEM